MKVAILCGGLGTRLREETEFRPKPMVEVGGRPLLWHVMRHYASYGHTEFVLLLGYKGDVIRRYFLEFPEMNGDVRLEIGERRRAYLDPPHEEGGWTVTLADTGDRAPTAARLLRAPPARPISGLSTEPRNHLSRRGQFLADAARS